MDKPAVPRFSSFKPKFDVKPTALDAPLVEDEPHSRSSQIDTAKDRHRQHESKRSHRVQDGRRRNDVSSPRRPRPPTSVAKDEFEESDLFIIDRRGDRKNVEFGSIHRYDIPAYHRIGNGCVLGARGRIDRDASTETTIVLRMRDDRYDSGARRPLLYHAAKLGAQARKLRVRQSIESKEIATPINDDYIKLSSSHPKHDEVNADYLTPDGASMAYRSIEGKAKPPNQPQDEDMEFASDSDGVPPEDTDSLALRRRDAELIKLTKERPSDWQAWLNLISLQDMLSHTGDENPTRSASERRTLADIRLAIYERALKHIPPTFQGHDNLRWGMLREGAVVWDKVTLAQRWREALRDVPRSAALRLEYLTLLQTNAASFNFSICKAAYVECLRALAGGDDPAADCNCAAAKVRVLLRLTCFIREAGYDELALALWQLMIEYHFCAPLAGGSHQAATLATLEEWWESECPRIGEEGAAGFDQYNSNGYEAGRRILATHSPTPNSQKTLAEALLNEAQLSAGLRLPATTDEDDEDPYRHVMFSDVRDVLGNMTDHLPRELLVDAFLCFLGLPPAHRHTACTTWQQDVLIQVGSVLYRPDTPAGLNTLSNQQWTQFDLFNGAPFLNCDLVGKEHACFTDRVLSTLIERDHADDGLAAYYLAFKAHCLPDEVVRTAKRLLKARPSGLPLYNAYALAEVKLGNYEKATAVWTAALRSVTGRDENAALLWQSWLLTALSTERQNETLGILVAMSNGLQNGASVLPMVVQDVSHAQRLKIARHCADTIEGLLLSSNYIGAVWCIDCLAWYNYLIAEHGLSSALPSFAKYEERLRNSADLDLIALEHLHQAKARMIQWHLQAHRPYRPSHIRNELQRSLAIFPENSILLNALAEVHGKNVLHDSLRESVVETAATKTAAPGFTSWHHRIVKELRRLDMQAATSSSIRNLFTRALLDLDSVVKHSVVLWEMWFVFEIRLLGAPQVSMATKVRGAKKESDPGQKAKGVFYDGLRCLPWHKGWAIRCLITLRKEGVVDDVEARTVLEVLEDREIRLRCSYASAA